MLQCPAVREEGAAWVEKGHVWAVGEDGSKEGSVSHGAGAVPARAARPLGTPFPGSPRTRPCRVTLRGRCGARWDLESLATWCGRRQAAEAGNAPGGRRWGHVG